MEFILKEFMKKFCNQFYDNIKGIIKSEGIRTSSYKKWKKLDISSSKRFQNLNIENYVYNDKVLLINKKK